MRVLVTRSEPEIPRELEALAARGHEGVACPLLLIKNLRDVKVNLGGVQAVLFTSCAGVRAMASADYARQIPVFTVGDATADAARECGYTRVSSAGGDWLSLVGLIRRNLKPEAGRLVHASGAAVSGNLDGTLVAEGFEVERTILYEAQLADSLSDTGIEALSAGSLNAVSFFSSRTAATFVRLAFSATLVPNCKSLDALCLSLNVARAAAEATWRKVRVAAAPQRDSLHDLLDEDDGQRT